MKLYSIALIALAFTATAKTASARILTVNADGTAQYTTIQAAFNAAFRGDEIIVEPGVYTGTGEAVLDMQGKTVLLRSRSGPETTIIDGESVRTGIRCTEMLDILGNPVPQARPTIQGFTIRNGLGEVVENTAGIRASYGGGMLILSESPTITDCIFRNNFADFGGGIYCQSFISTSRPILQNCTFEDNHAFMSGGGLKVNFCAASLSGCVFSGNRAEEGGGGVSWVQTSGSTSNCVFVQNGALYGGGWEIYESFPRISGCEFRDNFGIENVSFEGEPPGGAIFNWTQDGIGTSNPAISQTIFCGNQPDTIWPETFWRDFGGNQFEEVCEPEAPDGAVGPFLRGDSNGDSNLDLSDAISILRFLFLGADQPSCQAAADSNGDGNIDLTDAIYSLNFLFLAGEALPAPTECEISELESDISLGCENGGCG